MNGSFNLLKTTFLAILLAITSQAFGPTFGPKDSIGIERKGGKNLVIYKVESGETLFSIARKYRTTVAQVQALNPALAAGGVQKGQTLRLPALGGDKATQTASVPAPKGSEVEKIHVVTAGQTLFAIARQYSASVEQIKTWNSLTTNSLFEGQQLVVAKPAAGKTVPAATKPTVYEDAIVTSKAPVPTKTAEEKPPIVAGVAPSGTEPTPPPTKVAPKTEPKPEAKPEGKKFEPTPGSKPGYIRHTVKAGETLFAIARTYNATPADVQKENNLPSGAVQVGQVLEIKQGAEIAEKPATGLAEKVDETKNLLPDTSVTSSSSNNTLGYERIVERGIAEVSKEDDSRQYLCLHRTAPTGKVLQVKNEMNGVSVYVRVIGKLPDTGNNDKVVVKISRRAFAQLKAADNRFPVEVSYTAN